MMDFRFPLELEFSVEEGRVKQPNSNTISRELVVKQVHQYLIYTKFSIDRMF